MQNNSILHKITGRLIEKNHHPKALWLFEKLVYLWFIILALVLFPIKDILYGPDEFMLGARLEDSLINNFFLKLVYVNSYATVVYYLHLIAALWVVIGFPRVSLFIPKIIVFVTGWMFYYSAPPAFNGGYFLMIAYAGILVFSNPKSKSTFWIILSNLTYIAIIIQLFIVYSTAAYYKWTGTAWLDGSAVWIAANYSTYKNDWFVDLYNNRPWIPFFFTYVSFAYQTLFPIIVWFKKIKTPVLIIGVLFHAYTIFVMGIHFFGIAMILGYLLFINENSKILNLFYRKGKEE